MKTLVIWDVVEATPHWFIVDGDWSKYHGVYIDSSLNENLEDELLNLIYEDGGAGNEKHTKSNSQPPMEGYDKIIVCGTIP